MRSAAVCAVGRAVTPRRRRRGNRGRGWSGPMSRGRTNRGTSARTSSTRRSGSTTRRSGGRPCRGKTGCWTTSRGKPSRPTTNRATVPRRRATVARTAGTRPSGAGRRWADGTPGPTGCEMTGCARTGCEMTGCATDGVRADGVRADGACEAGRPDSTPLTTRRAGDSLAPARSPRGGGVDTVEREPGDTLAGRRAASPRSDGEPAAPVSPRKRGELERFAGALPARPGRITVRGRAT